MSDARSPVISINFLPAVQDKGGWFGDRGVEAKIIGEIAKGCADLLHKLGVLGLTFEVIKVSFGKATEDEKKVRIVLRAVFNAAGQKLECEAIIESEPRTNLTQQIIDKLVFEVGLKLRSLRTNLAHSIDALDTLAPFAFTSPYKP